MKTDLRRSFERLFYCLISVVLAVGTAHAQSLTLTTITDTIYRADGAPAAGQLVITWPAFTTANNKAVAAGEKTLPLGAGGALSTQLAPNEGATPSGSYYKVVYKLSDGTTATEYWTVPVTTPTTVGLIRATVVPSQVAAQLVTRQYVDNVLGAADIVHKAGTETITGVKTFSAPVSIPAPTASAHAATKGYVDAQVAAAGTDVMHLSGAETVTGVKTFAVAPILNGGFTVTAGGSLAGTITGDPMFSGNPTFAMANKVCKADGQGGADAAAKFTACVSALPSTGGTLDARGLEGLQPLPAIVTLNKPITLLLGAATFTCTMNDPGTASGCIVIASDNVEIIGLGKESSKVTQGNGKNIQNLLYVTGKQVRVSGIYFDGNEANQTIAAPSPNFYACIRTPAGADFLDIIGNSFTACGNRAVDIRGSAGAQVLNNKFKSTGIAFPGFSATNGGNAISIDDSGATNSTDYLVNGNYIERFGDTGIGTPSGKRGTITQNIVRCATDVSATPTNIESGIGGSGMEDVLIADNDVGACKAMGIGAGASDQDPTVMNKNVSMVYNRLKGTVAVPSNIEALDNSSGNTGVSYNLKAEHNTLVNGSIDLEHLVNASVSFNTIEDPDTTLNRGIRIADETANTTTSLDLIGNIIRKTSGTLSIGIDVQSTVAAGSTRIALTECLGTVTNCIVIGAAADAFRILNYTDTNSALLELPFNRYISMQESGGTKRNVMAMTNTNQFHFGNASNPTYHDGSVLVPLTDGGALGDTSVPLGWAVKAKTVQIGQSGSVISDSRELIQSSHSCGTTTTCANTANGSYREVWGKVTLSAGAATVTGISPAFTSTSSFGCVATSQSGNNATKAVPASTTSITVTGTGTDVVFYRCVGN